MKNATTNEDYCIDNNVIEINKNTYEWDEIILLIYCVLMLFGGTIANGLVVFLTYTNETFHEGFMYIRTAYAVVDIIFIWNVSPLVMVTIVFADLPERLICYMGDIGIG